MRRGLRRWPDEAEEVGARAAAAPDRAGLADARAVVATGVVAIAITLATTQPAALALVAGWLLAAWLIVRAGIRSLTGGLALAAPLALSTLAFGLVGGIGAELALRRAARVALLVLTAVWLRSAAGAAGLRTISLRAVRRLRRLPTLALSARVLAASAGVGNYGESARSLGRRISSVRKRPGALLVAVLGWIAAEARRLPGAADEARPGWSATETALVVLAAALVLATPVALLA